MRYSLALLALSPLFAPALGAQLPAPVQLPMPPEVLTALDLRSGTIQELLLPQSGRSQFQVRVSLGDALHTLVLAPHSIRAANFQLLVTDTTGTHSVPAPEDTTYSGTVEGIDGSMVAASLHDGQLEAHIRVPGGSWCVQPLTTVIGIAPRNLHVVYQTKDVVQNAAVCGVDHGHGDHTTPPGGSVGPAAMRLCEIALDCDEGYYARNGNNVNTTVASAVTLMYAVNAIYQNDVEIRHVITAVIVRTVPTYTTGPDLGCGATPGLLQEFRTRWLNNHGNVPRDVAHLLTGQGSFSGVVGCASVGVICTTSAYGASRAISGNAAQNVGLVAHEIGHNWSAQHCNAATPCNIMCASLGGCSGVLNSVGPSEVAQIVAHKNSRNCLSEPVRVDPNPAVWYRLNTRFQGPGLSLDVINDGNNNRMIMAASGAFTGQLWRFSPAPEISGTYRLSCLWQGLNLPMDTINGGADNNQPILAPIGAFTGQLWTLTDVPGVPGYVSLHNEFRGQNMALEGAGGLTGNRPVLTTYGTYTGQQWLLDPVASIDPAAATSFGTACRGRGGVPALQMTGGSLPWINENLTGEVTNVAAGAVPVLLIGTRLPTPTDLAFLQSPGCFLRVTIDVQLFLPVSGGRGTFTLPLPDSLPLVGATLPIQVAVVDPSHGVGNPLVAMTNGVDLRFGLR